MSRLRLTAFFGSLLATTVVLALALGPAFSAIPNPTNKKFYACFNKKTRVVKMLNFPKVSTCPKRHKLIKWNAKGIPGAAGLAGAAGPAGPTGAAGITRIMITRIESGQIPVATGTSVGQGLTCPAGKLVGGGYFVNSNVIVRHSWPQDNKTWAVSGTNDSGSPGLFTVYALCLTTEPGAVIASVKTGVKTTAISKASLKAKKGKKKRR